MLRRISTLGLSDMNTSGSQYSVSNAINAEILKERNLNEKLIQQYFLFKSNYTTTSLYHGCWGPKHKPC